MFRILQPTFFVKNTFKKRFFSDKLIAQKVNNYNIVQNIFLYYNFYFIATFLFHAIACLGEANILLKN